MKVVVIEDKPLIRRAIVETLNWSSLDCELVSSVADGLEGKKIIEQHKPDIIITDIRMPDMDGLQLAAFAIQHLKSCRVIIITGYQDFDYAKQCVRLGVMDYLLKPLNNLEIEATVTKAVAELTQERQEVQEREQLILTAKQQMLSDYLFGQMGQSSHIPDTYPSKLNVHRYGLVILTVASTVGGHAGGVESLTKDETLLRCDEILLSSDHVNPNEIYRFYHLNEIVYVYLFPQTMSEQAITQMLNARMRQIKQQFADSSGKGYRYKGSYPIRNLKQLKEQYMDLSSQLRLYFFNLTDQPDLDHVKLSILHELEQFQSYLATDAVDEMKARIQPYMTSISTYAAGNITVAKALVYELCLTIAKFYYKQYNNEQIQGQSVEEILNRVNTLDDMTQAESYVRSLLDVFQEQQSEETASFGALVKGVLRYIEENYQQEISLNIVADQFHISAGHLSRLLRKEVGASFVDIVTRTRIQAAKRLMRDPSKRIAEISEQTGFKNYIYFYQVFKKYEHISPQEYKKKL